MDNPCIKNNKRKVMIKTAAIICTSSLLLANLTGCYFLPSEEAVIAPPLIETPKVTFETVDVKKGNIEKNVRVSGTFNSAYQENLYFKFRGGNLKSINVKLGDKVNKGALVAELDTDSLMSQIKQQEIALRQSQIAQEKVKANPTASSYDLESAELNVKSSQIKLDDLNNEYQKSKLYSTISGYVTYIDTVNMGDYYGANKTLVTVADPTQLYLVYKGDNSSDFQVGVEVDVKYKGNQYKGEVVAGPNNLPQDANKNSKTAVYIKVKELPKDVQLGESADITLILEKREDVIVIPRSLVNNFGGRNYVQVLENGIKYERDVETGLQTATDFEIKKGLKEGDKIIQR